ncbi:NosD domain-containing protein [Methanospirillum stamsii]|uniref:Uncharacterized protein n=1 Tax=Methanospirillum stamsii TaxID=1277351 RepID=A0A2V2N9S1_9EURY|nr:NosD domain-containing protein [Methanospirillum stamsii]PWR75325.1 hypothetical protein DLD82_05970 [Methanospirillum stamsii]
MNMRQEISWEKQITYLALGALWITLFLFPIIASADVNISVNESVDDESNPFIIDKFPVIIEKPGDYYLTSSFTSNNTSISIRTSDVSINGMGNSIGGNYSAGAIGIDVGGSPIQLQNITLKNITLQEFDIGINCDLLSDCSISNVSLISNLRAGFQAANSSSFLFTDNEVKKNYNDITGGYGITVTNSHNMIFKDNLVNGNGKSDKSKSGGYFISNSTYCEIINSKISTNPGTGLRATSGSDDLVIKNCEISYNSGNGIISTESDRIEISDNVLEKNKGNNIDISSAIELSLKNNKINSGTIGLSIANTEHLTLSGNSLTNNRIGFDISGSDIRHFIHQVDNTNTINSRALIYLYNEKNKKIGHMNNPGMIVAVNCSDLTISDMVLSKTGAAILLAGCQNTSVEDVSFMDNGIGIRTDFNCKNITLDRLHAERNMVCGYYLSETRQFILQNLYGQENPLGIFLKNSHNGTIQKISMTQMSGVKNRLPSGLTMSNCSDIIVEHSDFSECSYAGLISDSQNIIISNNSFLKNSYAGAVILSGPTELTNNSIALNKESGVIFRAKNSLISGNSIKNNENHGLNMIESKENTISQNIFNNNDNILLTGSNTDNAWNESSKGTPASLEGGNFWGNPDNQGYSDVCVSDSSGYCMDPYIMDEYNIDYRPLSSAYTGYSILQISDINENGKQDLQDVVAFMKKISSGDTNPSYDFSNDGRVNLQDVVALFQLVSQ